MPPSDDRPTGATPTAGPTTAAGRALAGWIRPNLRSSWQDAVRAIEAEAGRRALAGFRQRVAGSSSPAAEELLGLIDEALAEAAEHPDR